MKRNTAAMNSPMPTIVITNALLASSSDVYAFAMAFSILLLQHHFSRVMMWAMMSFIICSLVSVPDIARIIAPD